MEKDVSGLRTICRYLQRVLAESKDTMGGEESLNPTWTTTMWEKVGLDVVFARDDLSGWVEALTAANPKNVAKFLYEDVIGRHGSPSPRKVVVKGGSEYNLGFIAELLECFRVRRIELSVYYS
jgi:hypothetical protein